jgi:hypothetical protein
MFEQTVEVRGAAVRGSWGDRVPGVFTEQQGVQLGEQGVMGLRLEAHRDNGLCVGDRKGIL